eukprot:763702-Pyramimonas_sp.AAC.1
MLAGPKVGERWEQVGSWTQGEKRGRGAMGVESTLAVIGTGGPCGKGSNKSSTNALGVQPGQI